jgi:hypothetical protein
MQVIIDGEEQDSPLGRLEPVPSGGALLHLTGQRHVMIGLSRSEALSLAADLIAAVNR